MQRVLKDTDENLRLHAEALLNPTQELLESLCVAGVLEAVFKQP